MQEFRLELRDAPLQESSSLREDQGQALQHERALQSLLARAPRMPFVVLVGWLERLLASESKVGERGPYRAEPVRFRQDPALTFSSADIKNVEVLQSGRDPRYVELTTNFAGLLGSASPLPPTFLERLSHDDDESAVQREFLDLFHHRLLGLFYRGLLKFDLPRSSNAEGFDHTPAKALDWVLLLAGFAPEHAERLTGLSRAQLLALSPLLVSYPANAERLRVALREVLGELIEGAEIHVLELQGGFVPIEPSARAKLGLDLRLGHNSTLGRRAPSPASEIAIHIAPLAPNVCARLSPAGDRHALFSAVLRLFTPETVRAAVELTPTHTPPARLGRPGVKLGRDAWLVARGQPAPLCFGVGSPEITRRAGELQ